MDVAEAELIDMYVLKKFNFGSLVAVALPLVKSGGNLFASTYAAQLAPEKFLGQLQPLRQGKKMKVTVTADNDTALHASGEADFIDNAVDAASGTIQVKATFANQDDRLVPGAILKVSLDLATLKNVVTVPAEAVQQNSDATSIYVVEQDHAHLAGTCEHREGDPGMPDERVLQLP